MIKCVVFDLDDTLYEFTPCHASALGRVREAVRKSGLCPDMGKWEDAHAAAFRWQFANHGRESSCHNRGIRFQRAFEQLGLPVGMAADLEALYWNSMLERMVPAPGAVELLARLKASGIRIGVGTNMTAHWQLRKIVKLGIDKFVDFVVSSEEAGAEKPAPGFFATVVEKAGVPAGRCMFVGDNADHDAIGASAAGMRGVWLQPDPAKRAARPDVFSIPSLSAIRV